MKLNTKTAPETITINIIVRGRYNVTWIINIKLGISYIKVTLNVTIIVLCININSNE